MAYAMKHKNQMKADPHYEDHAEINEDNEEIQQLRAKLRV